MAKQEVSATKRLRQIVNVISKNHFLTNFYHQTNPEVIVAGEKRVAADIDHFYLVAEQRDKIDLLRKLVHGIHGAQALIFLNKNREKLLNEPKPWEQKN